MIDVARVITRKYGYSFTFFDIPGFMKQLNQHCTQEDLLYPLTDFFIQAQDKLAAMQHKRYNNDVYRQAREQCGGRREPCLDDTVGYIVDFMLRSGIITSASGDRAAAAPASPTRRTHEA
jgi:hypothetical protein